MKSGMLSPAVAAAVFLIAHSAGAADFTALGGLDSGNINSTALAISSDGSTVVGSSESSSSSPDQEAFVWTSGGGMVPLGDLAGGDFKSSATGVSADGSTIVGDSDSSLGPQGFIWNAGTMLPIGHLPGGGSSSDATSVSDDGTVVAGKSDSTDSDGAEAFRWTGGAGFVPLGDLPGAPFISGATGISGDGNNITGTGFSASGSEAFLWTNGAGPMVGIGDLAGGDFFSVANGISNDGSTVVGISASAASAPTEAFAWTDAGGIVPLGDLPGGAFKSDAWAASGDGSVVVGTGTTGSGAEAFIWTMSTGILNLAATAAIQGAIIPVGWTLNNAFGISADGTSIVGNGINPDGDKEAWLITGLQLQDDDGDGIANNLDNCINAPNGPLIPDAGGNWQYDSNGDGYGNACDADFNGDFVVNGLDVGPFVAQFGTIGPDADFNGDGVVNGLDVGTFVNSFGQAPGPSGIAP